MAYMDTPDNYYAILGVPIDAENDTLKRAYRQLARRYHPDLAGPGGAIQMKRINRAYDVLSDAEKRRNYDAIIGGVIDFRGGLRARPRPRSRVADAGDNGEFSGLNIFSTKGPFRAGTVIHSQLGVISSLTGMRTAYGLLIAAGSLDGKGMLWPITNGQPGVAVAFAAHAAYTVESLRALRLSLGGGLLVGWGQLGLHAWDAFNGQLLWSYQLRQRAVSAHYSLDVVPSFSESGKRDLTMVLPLLVDDGHAPRAWGVRGTDVISHNLSDADTSFSAPLVCVEEKLENRQFWSIRLRTLSQDQQALITLSCANVPNEQQQMAVIRRWDLSGRTLKGKPRAQIAQSVLVGTCSDCTPPYAITPDAKTLAFVHAGKKILLCDTSTGSYSELLSGPMGGSSRLVISPDAQWVAVAREDSEINEGVIDLWSASTGQVLQKFYHPWQISALHFAENQLIVALTDGTIQVWER